MPEMRSVVRAVSALCALLLWALQPVQGEDLREAYRSPFGRPSALAVSPIDGTCWANMSGSITRVAANGTVLGQFSAGRLFALAVNSADGSCWITEMEGDGLEAYGYVHHVSASGQLEWSGGSFQTPYAVAVDAVDGSVWVGDLGVHDNSPDATDPRYQGACLVHLSATGAELWRGDFASPIALAVSPRDRSVWLLSRGALVHLSRTGQELWSASGYAGLPGLAVSPLDGSCWVGDQRGRLVHLAEDGTPLWAVELDGQSWSIAAGAADGSCWITLGADAGDLTVVHLSATGQELQRTAGVSPATGLAVNAADGSCWVGGEDDPCLMHLSAGGETLWSASGLGEVQSVAVDLHDSSVWAGVERVWEGAGRILHLSRAGAELWSGENTLAPVSLASNPHDGSLWVADPQADRLLHVASTGSELLRAEPMGNPEAVALDPGDGSIWVGRGGARDVAHLDANGSLLWSGGSYSQSPPISVSAHGLSVVESDGSCWVVDAEQKHVLHLSASGQAVATVQPSCCPLCLVADAHDGSCWVGHKGPEGTPLVTHFSAAGAEIGSYPVADACCIVALARNPRDGSIWVGGRQGHLIHLSASGEELSSRFVLCCLDDLSVDPSDGSVWVGSPAGVLVHLVPHLYVVISAPQPGLVNSGGTVSLGATVLDAAGHGVGSVAWSDRGAGGTFSPSASALHATYTAPVNPLKIELPITLSLTVTCDGSPAASETVTTTLAVRPIFTLSIAKVGLGYAKVNGALRTLPWSGRFDGGSSVTLEAVPSYDWESAGWSGTAAASASQLTLTMDQDYALTAEFTLPAGILYAFPLDYPEEELAGWTGWASAPGTGWEWGAPVAGGGQPNGMDGAIIGTDPGTTHSGDDLIGYVIGGNYQLGMGASGPPAQYLTTPPLDFRGRTGVSLHFWRWLEVEDQMADTAAVEVSAGTGWKPVWQNPTASPAPAHVFDTAWVEEDYPLPDADGKAGVQVRWVMGPTNSVLGTEYGGWNLDDIEFRCFIDAWSAQAEPLPEGLIWDQQTPLSVTLTNTGETTWDTTYALRSVRGATLPVSYWGLDRIPVSGRVAPGTDYEFAATLTAPAISTLRYSAPTGPTAPGIGDTLPCTWILTQDALGPLPGQTAGSNITISRFSDLQPSTAGFWARFYVEELAGAVPRVVQGYDDGTYRPGLPVTRDQIAVYIARAVGLDQSSPTGTVFSDIPTTYWAAGAVEACAKAKIISGYPDSTYQPTLPITRDGMCKLIANGRHYATPAFQVPVSVTAPPFTDVPADSAFATYITACKDANIVQGYEDGSFRPSLSVTRDQLAVFVWRAFLRDAASTLLLGGPTLSLAAPTAAEPAVGSITAAAIGTPLFASALFDAVRAGGAISVSFELRRQLTPDTFNPVGQCDASLSEVAVATARAAALTTGLPYLPAAAPIDTTGLEAGTYVLVTTVNGTPLERRVQIELE